MDKSLSKGRPMIDREEIHNFIVIGTICSIKKFSDHFNFIVEDGTGLNHFQYYFTYKWGNEYANDIKLENRVRIYASFRPFSGRYVYMASCVRSVEDYMEVIHHELEVIYWHLYFTKKNIEC
ncbi:hypothetical protein G6F57_010073 [Rhizopus arrhizus]|uniref:Uncharacterized protein n=1 Tax=Rhizopus oryzae TaxID=64495 RepID=A0A9P7BXC4_RHIOR|nr:hypothetical protein G6F23_008601 [Rhizopus arrhizus]KAG1409552.1 hypothetical protein G6F58_009338 [Rhizopus delemar]KAG0758197.1 hypothetical protein G6F24_009964 [Rhizopus arrhizus]KAG0784260.1 hypothetical protein G6F21_010017 [Rhizopus arrhizus]KAG0788749.1 hypothetical protein G6F22_006911 [Rhizopus arrhizus]